MISLFHFISVLFLLISAGYSQDEDEAEPNDNSEAIIDDAFVGDEELGIEEEEIITSSPDVIPSSLFSRYPDGRLPLGKVIEAMLGFKNIGQKSFNVTSIHGSFRYPGEVSIYVQNFTAWRGGALVRPGQHLTFLYYFYPDELLEPKDYIFISTIAYNDEENQNYTTTFYNGTIEMIEQPTTFDFQTVFSYFLILGVLSLIGYVIYLNLPKKVKSGFGAGRAAVETGTRNDAATSNWTSDALNKSGSGRTPKKQ